MSNSGFFVTGTDTGIGKTVVSAGLVRALLNQGTRVAGLKPVVSGSLPAGYFKGQTQELWEDIVALDIADSHSLEIEDRSPYRFCAAASPHFASEAEGIEISAERLLVSVQNQTTRFETIVVEGVGGVRVPLESSGYEVRDFICDLGMPVVLVVGLRLGCINHAILTIESLASKGILVAAWIANAGLEAEYGFTLETVRTLEERLGLKCSAVLPRFEISASRRPQELGEFFGDTEARVSMAAKALAPLAEILLRQ